MGLLAMPMPLLQIKTRDIACPWAPFKQLASVVRVAWTIAQRGWAITRRSWPQAAS